MNLEHEKLYKQTNLRIIFSITLTAVMGVASITPAFPGIIEYFQISTLEVGLLITVFTLPGVFLTPLLGVIADRYGRKTVIVPSLFLFAISGAACAFTNDFTLLLIFRVFQGTGAASLGSLNATLIGDLYRESQRAIAMGYNASVLSVGTASYPAIGGALALAGWNYPFLLPLFAIPIGLIVLFMLNNPEPERKESLINYLKTAINSIRKRQVVILFTTSIVTFIILYGALLTYFPILVAKRYGGSSLVIGVLMSISSITTAITAASMRSLIRRFAQRQLVQIAFLTYIVSLLLFAIVNHIYLLVFPIIIFGLSQGLNLPNIQSMLAGLAPLELRGIFMSVNGMVLRIGQTLGPIVMGLFFTIFGLQGVFITGAVLAALMLFILFFLE
jgi:MFS family permease